MNLRHLRRRPCQDVSIAEKVQVYLSRVSPMVHVETAVFVVNLSAGRQSRFIVCGDRSPHLSPRRG